MTTAAVSVAFAMDAVVGEPPTRLHPVAWLGRVVAPLDRDWARPRLVGALTALALPVASALAVGALVWVAGAWRPIAGTSLCALGLFLTTSLRRLLTVGREVTAASATDLDAARERLRALAGRDASTLSAGEVRSAVVESVGENLADGLVAPLSAFALGAVAGGWLVQLLGLGGQPAVGALALGAGGATWVKAVNTMDSMLGYRSKPVGWAPARLDDAVMWLPARASGVLIAAACLAPASLASARQWLAEVPSPNSGWPMGTAAAALDVRLVKPGVYDINEQSTLPTVADAERAIRRVGVAGVLAYLVVGVVVWG